MNYPICSPILAACCDIQNLAEKRGLSGPLLGSAAVAAAGYRYQKRKVACTAMLRGRSRKA